MLFLVLLSICLIACNFLVVSKSAGVHVALGSSIIASFCFPSYWKVTVANIPISVQSGACIACLMIYLILGGSLRFRMSLGDLAIGALAITAAVSDGWLHGGGAVAVATAYGEWILPYAAGRYAFGSISGFSHARFQIAAAILCMLTTHAIDLAFNRNIAFELTSWIDPSWIAPPRAKRFGIVRSAGLTEHPIFYAGALMALLPIAVTTSAVDRQTRTTKRYLISMISLGLLAASLSRGAVVAMIGALLFLLSTSTRRMAASVTVAILISVAAGWLFWPTVRSAWMSTGDHSERERLIIIDGKATRHSSSLARVRAFEVYGKAAARAGLFGYGTGVFATSPPNLPFLPKEAMASETIWTIENSYLLILLRFGYIGLTCFALMIVSACAIPLATRDADLRRHLLLFATSSLSIAFLLGTVYPSYQIVFPMLFLNGLGNALIDPNMGEARMAPLERS